MATLSNAKGRHHRTIAACNLTLQLRLTAAAAAAATPHHHPTPSHDDAGVATSDICHHHPGSLGSE